MSSLPPDIDKKIRQRFEDLLKEGEKLLQEKRRIEKEQEAEELDRYSLVYPKDIGVIMQEEFFAYKTKVVSLLAMLSSQLPHIKEISQKIEATSNAIALDGVVGYIHGLKDDYESGMLQNLANMIEAEIAVDYLGQAEQLLNEGQTGQYDHVPAAVLTGSILENALRKLCQRQNPPIPLTNAKGSPKTMNPLIDDLKKAQVFNELKAKHLRVWADIRNAAAHGKFTEFTRLDVEQMLKGVETFLTDYL